MRTRITFYFLLALVFVLSGCSQKTGDSSGIKVTNLKEVEPNNDRANAQSVKHGTAVKGFIGEPMDQDWYQITIPEDSSAILQAVLTGVTGLNLKMELFDSVGDEMTEVNKNKEGEGEIFTNWGLNPGDYYIRVRELWLKSKEKKANDSTFYVLKTDLAPVTPDVEFESNNRGVEATAIQAGQPMTGFISPYQDEDWFKLELPQEGHYYMAISLSSVEDVDTRLAVYDPIEALIMEKDSEGKGAPELIPNLGIDPELEFYYLVVKANKWQSNEETPYQLNVDFLEVEGHIEIEPNDRMVRATDLVVNDTIQGFIETGSDVDWYRVKNNDSTVSVLRLEAQSAKKVDLVITVLDQDEQELMQINDGEELEPEFLPTMGMLPRQVYFLKVENKLKNGNPNEFYSLVTELGRYYNDEEFEFNNSPETASALFPNRGVSGYIHPGGDIDFYRLDLTAQPKSLLEVKLRGILKVNTDLVLYNSEMEEIARAAERPAEETEKLTEKVDAGIYFLKVFGAGAAQSNYRDRYRLTTTVRSIF